MKTAAVIPAYNEGNNIKNVLNEVSQFVDEIIVVDDGSEDETYEIISNYPVRALRHEINLGKGAAMKTGCEAALKLNCDVILCLDADGQHKPDDIPRFLEKLQQDNDIVFGSRTIGRNMPLAMFLGNKFLSAAICRLFKVYLSDTQSGFRAFTKSAYEKMRWESNDYSVETEMIINMAKNNLRFKEIEIDTIYHDNYKGTTPVHGMQIFLKILKWKFL